MDTIIMTSKNCETSDSHRLLLNPTDKTDLRKKFKYIALSNLSIYYTLKKLKNHARTINLKFQLKHVIKNLNYLMDRILYQIFKITLNISLKT